MLKTAKNGNIIVSTLHARDQFWQLIASRGGRAPIAHYFEKRGMPKAVLLSIRDYVRLAAPEPEVLRLIGGESERKGTHKISSGQIDRIVKSTRMKKSRRR